jgi:hypothetical protein
MRAITIVELNDGKFQWIVTKANEVVNFGFADDNFEAYKIAQMIFDKI